jgi:uroporphyrinogen-III synthase
MYRVFISRILEKDSCFKDLNPIKYHLIEESLIEFEMIQVDLLPKADWYFFYSKNGVKYFLQNFGSQYFSSCDKINIACMGAGTKDYFLKHIDYPVSFTGSGKPNQVTKAFLKIINPSDRLIFFTAFDSLHSVGNFLPPEYNQIQIPLYYNRIKKNFQPHEVDILIFTSPKNVEAYFQFQTVDQQVPIICIGPSTANKLHEIGRQEVIHAITPSENGLLQALQLITWK